MTKLTPMEQMKEKLRQYREMEAREFDDEIRKKEVEPMHL
jgi:hypothetical protein